MHKRGVPWILTKSSTFEFGVIVPRDRGARKKADTPWESHSLRARWDDPDVASLNECTATLKGILIALVLWVDIHSLNNFSCELIEIYIDFM